MKRKRYSEERIISILKEHEVGATAPCSLLRVALVPFAHRNMQLPGLAMARRPCNRGRHAQN